MEQKKEKMFLLLKVIAFETDRTNSHIPEPGYL